MHNRGAELLSGNQEVIDGSGSSQRSMSYRARPWSVWLLWVIAEMVGTLLAGLVWVVFPEPGILSFLLSPFILALFQWFVLVRCLPELTLLRWSGFAILGTIAVYVVRWAWGLLFLYSLSNTISFSSDGIPTTASSGLSLFDLQMAAFVQAALLAAVLGIAQWVALRPHIRDAWWWVIIVAVAAVVDHTVSIVMLLTRFPLSILQAAFPLATKSGQINQANLRIFTLITDLEHTLFIAAITGFALVFLLQSVALGNYNSQLGTEQSHTAN